MKKKVRIGWVPYCIKAPKGICGMIGVWGGGFGKIRAAVAAGLHPSYTFRILPVFVEIPKEAR